MLTRVVRTTFPTVARWPRFYTIKPEYVTDFRALLSSSHLACDHSVSSADLSELDGDDCLTEKDYSSTVIHGRGVYEPLYHPKTHGIPVALLHFRGFIPERMDLFMHFAAHAAAALEIPISKPVYLPSKRSLWTVPKGPFAHKKKQENFERIVHKRAIKAWDADSEVVDRWLKYIRLHAMGGVGLKVTRWERAPVGIGTQQLQGLKEAMRTGRSRTNAQKVRDLGAEIVKRELEAPSDNSPEPVASRPPNS
jgi:small subunit ribosomal protein S10